MSRFYSHLFLWFDRLCDLYIKCFHSMYLLGRGNSVAFYVPFSSRKYLLSQKCFFRQVVVQCSAKQWCPMYMRTGTTINFSSLIVVGCNICSKSISYRPDFSLDFSTKILLASSEKRKLFFTDFFPLSKIRFMEFVQILLTAEILPW